MTKFYTARDGTQKAIADMPTPYLVNAHKKAVASEERRHTHAHLMGEEYENAEREAEIDAMAAEIARRDAAYAEQQGAVETGA